MKNKVSIFIYVISAIIVLFLLRIGFSEYNTKKTISACILAQKQILKSFDLKKAKKICEEKIK